MDRSVVAWIGVIVVVLVFLDLFVIELRRILREGKRLIKRIEGYGELPILSMLASSERDVDRIVRAIDALPPLVARAKVAVGVIRSYLPKGSSPG